ncbi:ATP12 family chaperone protein [Novosphingobium sp.]|uniref:ATP12 family chaperone protein n=1 Tax=Novosphingobium sp. TaxID=1874826 RepID=UPI003B51B69F
MKRFYREVALGEEAAGFRVLLDGRAIRTQGGAAQVVPTAALGQAMVMEWADQGETIDPARFTFRDMADYAIDVVAPDPAATVAALVGYAGSDTLCYRGFPDEPIAARQTEQWEPLVCAAEARFGVAFTRVSGLMPRPQPAATLGAMLEHIATLDPFALAALRNLAGLAASVIIGLAALEPDAPLGLLWEAANLEELWQAELWGKEPEAEARRARQRADFFNAARFAELARPAQ